MEAGGDGHAFIIGKWRDRLIESFYKYIVVIALIVGVAKRMVTGWDSS